MFSKACEHGIRACLFIAKKSLNNERVRLKEIALEIDAPEAFTAKILQKLVKHRLVYSIQGAYGGFEMVVASMKKINLEDIVIAIDGDAEYADCVLGLKNCSEVNPCPAHKYYKNIKSDFKIMIKKTTVFEMVNDLNEGRAFLKIE